MTGAVGGYAGAFDHLVGLKYAVHGVAALLPLDAFFIELRAVSFGYQARVGKEYVESFGLSEDGGTYAALTSAEYYKSVHLYSIANSPRRVLSYFECYECKYRKEVSRESRIG